MTHSDPMSDAAAVHYGEDRTAPMVVHNMGFLLDRLGADCAPLQFLRELTVNAIEAIQALPESKGEVVWDFDHSHFDLEGVFKLAIIDTGIGMTGPEMERYINRLSSSGREQSVEGNYGVGAKISAATRNHAGVVYLSWKDGKGAMIHLWRNPETGTYGLRQLQLPSGKYAHWAPIADELKPEQIKDHGTMVILLGNRDDEDTVAPPPGTATPSRWIARYLNSRFFTFPEGITVRAREGWQSENPDTNILRTVKGAREFLERHKQTAGTVDVGDALAHWWILKDVEAVSQASGANLPGGHIAALHHDELYELKTGRQGSAMLQTFGVSLAHARVVLYLQPKDKSGRLITTNTARTLLLLDGEPLPWGDWAERFREKFPHEITELMDSVARDKKSADYSKSIKERLREIEDMLRLKKYRPAKSGPIRITSDLTMGAPRTTTEEREQRTRSRRGTGGGREPGELYTLFVVEEGGQPGREVKDRFDVKATWVSEADVGSPDRAAHYIRENNELLINEDFRVFTGFIDRWEKLYKGVPGVRQIITEVVHEWFEQQLVEVIYAVDFLRGDKEWSESDITTIVSDEALTAAVLPRYHIEMAVRRALGAKLGSVKERSA
ncbi:MAG TPA: ATP-binding protein [Gemmatimonadaceae bacterium]|nr:ATP-binding protein [Gemmatimonadaceae bacterium]